MLSVPKTIHSLLVYDRQELLKIKSTVDFTANYSQGGSKTFPPPLLTDVPSHLICIEGPPPQRRRRRGARSGWLVRIKAWLASPSELLPVTPECHRCFQRLVARGGLAPTSSWLIPVVGLNEERRGLRTGVPHSRSPGGRNYSNLRPLCRSALAADISTLPSKCALINARSVMNKTFILKDFFITQAVAVLFLTETWIAVGESDAFTDLLTPDCTFLNSPRTTGRIGGIATVLKSSLHCKLLAPSVFSSFELSSFVLGRSDPVLCVVIFRPPKYNKHFIKEFSDFLSSIMTDYCHGPKQTLF